MSNLNALKNDVSNKSDIPGFLSEKLAGHEVPVDPGLWSTIAEALPAPPASAAAASGAATASTAAKVALWLGAAALAGAVAIGVYTYTAEPTAVESPDPPTEALQNEPELHEPAAEKGVHKDAAVSAPAVTHEPVESTPTSSRQSLPEKTTPPVAGESPTTPVTETTPDPLAGDAAATNDPSATERPSEQAEAQSVNTQPEHTAAGHDAPLLLADFNVEFDGYDELAASFTATGSGAEQWHWQFGDGEEGEGPSVVHRYPQEGDYTVTLTAHAVGREPVAFEALVRVQLTPKLVLPNIFTPNNDGLNDVLNITPDSRNITVLRMLVIDGRGNIVFEQTGEGPGWDGNDPFGSPMPEGTYRLVVNAQGNDGTRLNETSAVRLQR